LISLTEISLTKEGDYVGDRITAFYCTDCGYIGLYRE